MNNELSPGVAEVQRTAKLRKPYHSPRIEDYGAVNELTRSGMVLDPDDMEARSAPDGFLPGY